MLNMPQNKLIWSTLASVAAYSVQVGLLSHAENTVSLPEMNRPF